MLLWHVLIYFLPTFYLLQAQAAKNLTTDILLGLINPLMAVANYLPPRGGFLNQV